ncbi:NAD(P)-binding protein [Polyplosphaeria fusca]|uniref:NAD(P)-binding protein n=1 Tax=Polyplosphaeria fusca TaxID=682080 RepID=A0A9P4R043_9PLEO|nr:NAD(P)-binding protein [Polyplosphaeria fusca]
MSWVSPSTQLLLIGAGELGTALLPHLSSLPNIHICLGVRQIAKHTQLASLNVSLTAIDLDAPSPQLSSTFAKYDVVVSCTGFVQSAGAMSKLANEVLEAGRLRRDEGKERLWFFPWQWGVDYDVTGDGDGVMPLFGEQRDVRELLRKEAAQAGVKWTIVSTGIFMSFLFEQFWGVVERKGEGEQQEITVRALGGWDHGVVVTDVSDIGRVLARIVAGDVDAEDKVLYVAGDSVKYSQLADIVERVAGKEVQREAWTEEHLRAELAKTPEDPIKKYRVVFARNGVFWEKERTVNYQLKIPTLDVETYAKEILSKD